MQTVGKKGMKYQKELGEPCNLHVIMFVLMHKGQNPKFRKIWFIKNALVISKGLLFTACGEDGYHGGVPLMSKLYLWFSFLLNLLLPSCPLCKKSRPGLQKRVYPLRTKNVCFCLKMTYLEESTFKKQKIPRLYTGMHICFIFGVARRIWAWLMKTCSAEI